MDGWMSQRGKAEVKKVECLKLEKGLSGWECNTQNQMLSNQVRW